MYNAIKHRLGARSKAAIVAVLCAAYLLCFAAVGYAAPEKKLVHVDGTLKVEAVEVELLQPQYIDEANSGVTANGNKVDITLAGLACPGAGAVVRVHAKNTGTLKATLVDISNSGASLDFIKVDMADVPIGEILTPGETCIFDVAIYWDPARTDITESHETAEFEIVLTYENDEYVELPSGEDPDNGNGDNGNGGKNNGGKNNGNGSNVPKTGDLTNYGVFAVVAVVAAVVMIVCLIFIIFGKKKKKEDDE